METLILNGSARKNGNTNYLLSHLAQQLKGEIILFNPFFDAVSPCTDCRYCATNPGCCIQDAMQNIYRCIETCNHVVIASPIYFYDLTPPLLSVLSRFQPFFKSGSYQLPSHGRPKRGGIILTGGGSGGYKEAHKKASLMLKMMNAQPDAIITSLHTDSLPAEADTQAVQAVDGLAALWNSQ